MERETPFFVNLIIIKEINIVSETRKKYLDFFSMWNLLCADDKPKKVYFYTRNWKTTVQGIKQYDKWGDNYDINWSHLLQGAEPKPRIFAYVIIQNGLLGHSIKEKHDKERGRRYSRILPILKCFYIHAAISSHVFSFTVPLTQEHIYWNISFLN